MIKIGDAFRQFMKRKKRARDLKRNCPLGRFQQDIQVPSTRQSIVQHAYQISSAVANNNPRWQNERRTVVLLGVIFRECRPPHEAPLVADRCFICARMRLTPKPIDTVHKT